MALDVQNQEYFGDQVKDSCYKQMFWTGMTSNTKKPPSLAQLACVFWLDLTGLSPRIAVSVINHYVHLKQLTNVDFIFLYPEKKG